LRSPGSKGKWEKEDSKAAGEEDDSWHCGKARSQSC
jgi:hypothetical protein